MRDLPALITFTLPAVDTTAPGGSSGGGGASPSSSDGKQAVCQYWDTATQTYQGSGCVAIPNPLPRGLTANWFDGFVVPPSAADGDLVRVRHSCQGFVDTSELALLRCSCLLRSVTPALTPCLPPQAWTLADNGTATGLLANCTERILDCRNSTDAATKLYLDRTQPLRYPAISCGGVGASQRVLRVFTGPACRLWRADNEELCWWNATAQAFSGTGCVPAEATRCACTHLTGARSGLPARFAKCLLGESCGELPLRHDALLCSALLTHGPIHRLSSSRLHCCGADFAPATVPKISVCSAEDLVAIEPEDFVTRLRMFLILVLALFVGMHVSALLAYLRDAADRKEVLRRALDPEQAGFKEQGPEKAWTWLLLQDVPPEGAEVFQLSGSFVNFAAICGLPYARLRASVPEEVLSGVVSHMVGRARGLSADWLQKSHEQHVAHITGRHAVPASALGDTAFGDEEGDGGGRARGGADGDDDAAEKGFFDSSTGTRPGSAMSAANGRGANGAAAGRPSAAKQVPAFDGLHSALGSMWGAPPERMLPKSTGDGGGASSKSGRHTTTTASRRASRPPQAGIKPPAGDGAPMRSGSPLGTAAQDRPGSNSSSTSAASGKPRPLSPVTPGAVALVPHPNEGDETGVGGVTTPQQQAASSKSPAKVAWSTPRGQPSVRGSDTGGASPAAAAPASAGEAVVEAFHGGSATLLGGSSGAEAPRRAWVPPSSEHARAPPAAAEAAAAGGALLSRTAVAEAADGAASLGGGGAGGKDLREQRDVLASTALVFALMAVRNTVPPAELNEQVAKSARFLRGTTDICGRDLIDLVNLFTSMLSPENIPKRQGWLPRSRLWRLIILQRPDGGFDPSEGLALALNAHVTDDDDTNDDPLNCQVEAITESMPEMILNGGEGEEGGSGQQELKMRVWVRFALAAWRRRS